ncbi:BlaB/IND/MUS family subclass B1 metallo-beta-lactamase [Limibacter armeniacum]|uniref:BlaB/IND/MUS family subclass B1 metallo-beta-lactamase n=1 Tax=Limibacter armeniacum TaxID=466084 RepID=UPI002FE4FF70
MKKTLFTFLLFFGALFFASAQSEKPLEITPLTGDFYVYTTYNTFNGVAFPSNSMYVVTSEGVVLIDTPWDKTQLQPLLDSIKNRHGKEVVLSVSTHYHDDRTAGVETLKKKGVRTYATEQTLELCKKEGNDLPEFTFSKDTVFTVGNHQFETYYAGEGHTPDNIVIWFGKEKILYGGCLIKSTESTGLGNTADANLQEWAHSIKNVIKKYPKRKYIIPGHQGWDNKSGLEHTLQLLEKNGY